MDRHKNGFLWLSIYKPKSNKLTTSELYRLISYFFNLLFLLFFFRSLAISIYEGYLQNWSNLLFSTGRIKSRLRLLIIYNHEPISFIVPLWECDFHKALWFGIDHIHIHRSSIVLLRKLRTFFQHGPNIFSYHTLSLIWPNWTPFGTSHTLSSWKKETISLVFCVLTWSGIQFDFGYHRPHSVCLSFTRDKSITQAESSKSWGICSMPFWPAWNQVIFVGHLPFPVGRKARCDGHDFMFSQFINYMLSE